MQDILHVDDNQDLSSTAKSAAFCPTLQRKEEALASLTATQKILEGGMEKL